MAVLTFTIPTAVTNRVLDAIALKFGYTGFLADKVTVQTKAEFIKAWMTTQVMNAVKEQEANTAASASFAAAIVDVNANIVIT